MISPKDLRIFSSSEGICLLLLMSLLLAARHTFWKSKTRRASVCTCKARDFKWNTVEWFRTSRIEKGMSSTVPCCCYCCWSQQFKNNLDRSVVFNNSSSNAFVQPSTKYLWDKTTISCKDTCLCICWRYISCSWWSVVSVFHCGSCKLYPNTLAASIHSTTRRLNRLWGSVDLLTGVKLFAITNVASFGSATNSTERGMEVYQQCCSTLT